MVKVYLVNAKRTSYDFSLEKNNGVVLRNNLTSVPSLLRYNKIDNDEFTFFRNSIGAEISLQYMGEYFDSKSALDDFNSRLESDVYHRTYERYKSKTGRDSDWNMILVLDESLIEPVIQYNAYITPTMDLNEQQFFCFLDACMIYQSFYIVRDFVISLSLISPLDKFDVYLLGYCIENCGNLKNPSYFLVNGADIKLLSQIYENWGIYEFSNEVMNMLEKAAMTYDLVSKYDEKRKSTISSRLFSILTIILGFTSLYSFFDNLVVRIVLIVIFSFFAFIVFCLSVKDIITYFKDRRDFTDKRAGVSPKSRK